MVNIARKIFYLRVPLLFVFSIITIFLGYHASQLEVATDFSGMIPMSHEYMKNYQPFKDIFGGGNGIKVSVSRKNDTILDKAFLETLIKIEEDVMFVKGVDRLTVRSLVSPETQFVSVTEEGFEMNRIVALDIPDTEKGMLKIKNSIQQAGLLGRMVSMDLKSALITGNIYEAGVDYTKIYKQLNEIRDKYTTDDVSVHINGFAMVVGFVTDALPKILTLFGITALITVFILWRSFHRFWCAVLPLFSGGLSVLWGLGISRLIGMKLDPMTTIVPFLIFSVGVSHGIQMMKRYLEECNTHVRGYDAAMHALVGLLLPGVLALVTDVIGFLTIMMVPIGMIQDLAKTASIGIACIIVANIIGLTLTLSFFSNQLRPDVALETRETYIYGVLRRLSLLTWGKNAYKVVGVSLVLLISSFFIARTMQVGDVNPGEPLLWEDSVYNQDAAKMSTDFMLGVDTLSIVASGDEDGICKNIDILTTMSSFEWELSHIAGVTAVISPILLAKAINDMVHEGDIRQRALPKTSQELAYLFTLAGSTSDTIFMNMGCQSLNIRIFLSDHKGDTIRQVIQQAKAFIADNPLPGAKFVLAGANAGVMAATNEEVAKAKVPMLAWVYFSIFIFCLIIFRNIKAPLFILAPLFMVSIASTAFMKLSGLGLNVNTLPVASLGVGIGVDYSIYIYSRLMEEMKQHARFEDAVKITLNTSGAAVLYTALTLSAGVLTWLISDLKFQADMGLLLGFIFITNMISAMVLMPSLVYIFEVKNKAALIT